MRVDSIQRQTTGPRVGGSAAALAARREPRVRTVVLAVIRRLVQRLDRGIRACGPGRCRGGRHPAQGEAQPRPDLPHLRIQPGPLAAPRVHPLLALPPPTPSLLPLNPPPLPPP